MKSNVVQEKSYLFALDVINACRNFDGQVSVLIKQVLRSGTSIGANVEEAIGAESRSDFIHKFSIAYKEARETKYWIRLLTDSGHFDKVIGDGLIAKCEELLRIIGAIQKSTKANMIHEPVNAIYITDTELDVQNEFSNNQRFK